MRRILRAFIWMRWRMLVNSLERTGSRDTLERFSLAIEKLGPILAIVLLVPSALMLAALGAAAGYSLARGDAEAITFQAARFILLLLPAVVVVGPLVMPGSDRANPTRLLLLPISRSTLYFAHTAASFGDPWTILSAPLIVFLAIGLLAGGAPLASLAALIGAVLLIAVLVGMGGLVISVLHLVFRNRRRGELVALIFIVFVPLVSMVPALIANAHEDAAGTSLPAWLMTAGTAAIGLLPPHMYLTATQRAADGMFVASLGSLMALTAFGVLVHALGFRAFRSVLDSPASSGGRRDGRMNRAWTLRIPGLSTAASAVALAHVRLALRTPRGRSILLSPLMLFVFFGVVMWRGAGAMDFGPFKFQSGLGLAAFTSFFCLMSVVPISMNQFAVDGAGLTMTLVSPLTEKELLAGKAVGNAIIGVAPSLVCLLASLLMFPGGSPALWIAIPLGLIAVYLIVAPVAAIASATFPKAVDLNSIGSNNAHGLAALAGMVSFVAASAPPLLLVFAATTLLKRPGLAPVFIAAWCLVAYAINRILFVIAARVFERRRENLAML